ncbi:MAG: hypothetical protein QF819_02475 [Gemmatimonadota bacterium]|nr:hypothetical protein [Gemmatimonadota bacterium]MDP6802026.1 hypothetical protein [Gemmatimonadota bacterium]MDP7031374.1 hypothetical protein [Gemmatimonadota bacterium]
MRGTLHRGAAVLFSVGCVWHLIYLCTARGRQFLRDMWPRISDGADLWNMLLHNLGRPESPPRFGRFSFVEKMEYWALIWGSVIMAGTGLFLWFDNVAVQYIPKGVLDVLLIIHFLEAVLATLAIAIWHFYFTVLRPGVYPGNPSWLTGKMPLEMHRHEHPAEYDAEDVDA